MDTPSFETDTVTQIIYLSIPPDQQLDQRNTHAGDEWDKALNIVTESPGFKKLYWGRRLEEPEKVQLHIVWKSLDQATSFTSSPQYRDGFLPLVEALLHATTGDSSSPSSSSPSSSSPQPTTSIGSSIRHATLRHQALGDPFGAALLGRPVGTAVYLGCGAAWHEGAWPLWTHVVRRVDGCLGVAGGRVREAVGGSGGTGGGSGAGNPGPPGPLGGLAYLVYVAWRSVAHHEAYHRSEHFARHAVILTIGVEGWTEYGHVVFREIREAGKRRKEGTASLL